MRHRGRRVAGTVLSAVVLSAGPSPAQEAPAFHVDARRLQDSLEKLSEFGRNPEGGVTRIGFSETDLAARAYVEGLMKAAGLQVRVDPAGNLFGRREGSEKLPVLLFGSHIDSVIHGGNYDGDVGTMGAIEVMRALKDGGVRTRHPLEAVVWTNEEGNHFGLGTLGSGVAAGLLGPEILDRKDDQGLTLADWLRRYGQDPARLTEARIPRGAVAAFLELHIEQGPHLDEGKVPIGVVQGIVGLRRWKCVTTGSANHAGTTPMNRRHDALAAASRSALAVRDVIRAEPGRQVGTVGYLRAEPGAINVIPGRAEFPVELRDLDAAKIDRLWERVQEKFAQIDGEEGVETRCTALDDVRPARSDADVQAAIRDGARSLGLATLDLPSGAVQDAQQIAVIAPMGMIFVPSRDGISHSPREFTSPQDIANGAEVLYRTLLLLDARLDGRALAAPVPRAPAAAQRVALTFDDLPVHAALPPGMTRTDVARSILATLKAHRAPAIYGFVNAKSLDQGPEGAEVLRLWRAAGHPLANHAFSHMDLSANTAEAFEQDVLANEPTLKKYMADQDWHWLRFPYLRAGDTLEKRRAVAGFLKDQGYRVAEVTLNFDDWAYNDPYARCAARNDTAALEWLKESYVRRAAEALAVQPRAARLLFGRDIGHVMLLHIGAFETVMLPRLLEMLQQEGFRLVALPEAQSDPVYAIDPGVASTTGATLLDQVAAAKHLPAPVLQDDSMAKLGSLCR